MRIHKYRAWDKKKKCMSYGNFMWHLTFDGIVRDTEGKEAKQIIPLEYTGLKDRNNVEIYEGDLVEKYKWDDMGHSQRLIIVEVIFYRPDREFGSFLFKEIKVLKRFEGNERMMMEEIYRVSKEDKVIGNIYENPKLLKK